MTDAEPLIDLSAPRYHAQVTPRGRRRRRAAIIALAAAAVVVAGGTGYAVTNRAAELRITPATAPTAKPTSAPALPGSHRSPALDPIKHSPAG
ncbi:hypothetical protein [Paractinoplanes durhamensis]|uniref:Uncharacterized protein n=1 Tax=Paractinoplanes durhamensis TaxID=113563 RepID=A0ABQ3Z954_9ACTN|nr:hypothetical protein [Actinoplanes durhamensis]GIE06345.1 hypothetical protein Adu01nite_76950 [Actinoplanes durhamensis]